MKKGVGGRKAARTAPSAIFCIGSEPTYLGSRDNRGALPASHLNAN
jgi:hypothetical protein